jgi:hypothetical protein
MSINRLKVFSVPLPWWDGYKNVSLFQEQFQTCKEPVPEMPGISEKKTGVGYS